MKITALFIVMAGFAFGAALHTHRLRVQEFRWFWITAYAGLGALSLGCAVAHAVLS